MCSEIYRFVEGPLAQMGYSSIKCLGFFIQENLGLEDSIIADISYIIKQGSWERVLGKLKGYIDLDLLYYCYFGCAGSSLESAGFLAWWCEGSIVGARLPQSM